MLNLELVVLNYLLRRFAQSKSSRLDPLSFEACHELTVWVVLMAVVVQTTAVGLQAMWALASLAEAPKEMMACFGVVAAKAVVHRSVVVV
ncbi:MAG: hypothetical protein V2I33_25785 [Kangiellaceae bacterium]|jgi:hypothetical protein|nr:hypothetical protein [Kangiellaceae bacterium]